MIHRTEACRFPPRPLESQIRSKEKPKGQAPQKGQKKLHPDAKGMVCCLTRTSPVHHPFQCTTACPLEHSIDLPLPFLSPPQICVLFLAFADTRDGYSKSFWLVEQVWEVPLWFKAFVDSNLWKLISRVCAGVYTDYTVTIKSTICRRPSRSSRWRIKPVEYQEENFGVDLSSRHS